MKFLLPLAASILFLFLTSLSTDLKTFKPNLGNKAASSHHKIILDTSTSSDQALLESLKFTNYSCVKLDRTRLQCGLILSSTTDVSLYDLNDPILTYKSPTGSELSVFQTKNGASHLSLLSKDEGLSTYSFTSLESLSRFTRDYGDQILPEDFALQVKELKPRL